MTRVMLVPISLAIVVAAGCGSSSKSSAGPAGTEAATTNAPGATTTAAAGSTPGALQAEANSAAAGDIPDNQVFLIFRNGVAGYSIKYPEGWAQLGSGNRVTFRDKNNIVRIVVAREGAPTAESVRADLGSSNGVRIQTPPETETISANRAIKVVYSTESAPNAVTGKRVKLIVDRYYYWKGGRVAVVDLGTPEGVDNVDAYRLMSESYRWS